MSGTDFNELARSLGRVEGKLDSLVDLVKTGGQQQDTRHDALAKRVGRIESKQHWYSGAAATAGALFGLFMGRH